MKKKEAGLWILKFKSDESLTRICEREDQKTKEEEVRTPGETTSQKWKGTVINHQLKIAPNGTNNLVQALLKTIYLCSSNL